MLAETWVPAVSNVVASSSNEGASSSNEGASSVKNVGTSAELVHTTIRYMVRALLIIGAREGGGGLQPHLPRPNVLKGPRF